jgi:diacylglycerol kinase (ATP)
MATRVRVSLFHNENAGDRLPLDRIRDAIAQHGHDLVSVVETATAFERLLKALPDIVVAAGGDGTVALAARALARHAVPLAILPLGTANNIARSVGIAASINDVIGRWETARRVPFDLGLVDDVCGRRSFVEAVGSGLIPTAIADVHERSDRDELPTRSKLAGAVRTFGKVLSRLQPVEWTIVADGVRTSREFLLVEVLNIRSIGPNLVLAADANPSDGFFHVVMGGEEHRDEVARYLRDLLEGRASQLPLLLSQRARHVTLEGAADIHVDDEVRPGPLSRVVSMHVVAGALELLV